MKYGKSYTLITTATAKFSRTIMYYRRYEIDHICSFLTNKDNISILDYGCNTGYLLELIKKNYLTKILTFAVLISINLL